MNIHHRGSSPSYPSHTTAAAVSDTRKKARELTERVGEQLRQSGLQRRAVTTLYNLVLVGLLVTSMTAFYCAATTGRQYLSSGLYGTVVTRVAPRLATGSAVGLFVLAGAVRLACAIRMPSVSHQYLAMLTYIIPFVTCILETFVARTSSLRVPKVQLTLGSSGAMLGLMSLHLLQQWKL